MTEVREKLKAIEQKHKLFKQQQFLFIAALARSREQARDRAGPVCSVAQVRRYVTHYCSNATDRRVFLLFLEIMEMLETVFELLQSSAATQSHSSEALDACKKIFSPGSDISQLQAHYPHDEINRLSCNEARNYYGGVVSVIPVTFDLLRAASFASVRVPTPAITSANEPLQKTRASTAENVPAGPSRTSSRDATRPKEPASKRTRTWHACKPAWKPPGPARTRAFLFV
ncbi:sperm acrosome-associated protein 9 [Brachyhypopomus gauderio]|uniref:sperm acrosome-associated protein 9 n=1 Tax=Brachyhypopomus gauderio TaxID=698409 RepID=UPI0040430C54